MAEIRLEVVFGRSMWLAGQRNLLKGIAVHLHQHQWTILQAPEGVTWPASDNPVIRLNYQSAKKYTFGGGWGSNGTEIFMPLNPTRMLYTRIGSKRPERGTVLNFQMAGMLAKFVRKHAFRYIFSPTPDELISKLRPRHVSREAYQSEKEQQEKWAQAQVDAELNLNRPLPGG